MSATILIVEDDKELRETMESFLLKKGYNVVSSPDGWSCLKEVVVKHPDAIIMDINMPKLNGLNALDLIKVTRLSVQVPILVMSAKTDDETIQKALALGADDFVEKPFSYEKALSYIELQLIDLSPDSVKGILVNLKTPNPDFEFSWPMESGKFECYPVSYQGLELSVLVKTGLNPADAAKLSSEEMKKAVNIFSYGSKKWKKLYPKDIVQAIKTAA